MTIRTAVQQGAALLEQASVIAPRLTAEVLLCHALGRERAYLYGHPEEELSEVAWIHYGRYLHERLGGKPTQYITRRQEFYGREFRVGPAVLIPRPETEHVVETAIELGARGRRVADVGCGSGAIAVTLRLEGAAAVCGTDVSREAIEVARENARRLGAEVWFVNCDLLAAIAPCSFDFVVSNPPYVPLSSAASLQREIRDWEPGVAVFAGETGLEFYGRLAAEAPRALRPGGWLIMELGYTASEPVTAMLRGGGWRDIRVTPDLAGIPRVAAARRAP